MILKEHIEPFRFKQMLLIHVKISNVILYVSIHSEGERRQPSISHWDQKHIQRVLLSYLSFSFPLISLLEILAKRRKKILQNLFSFFFYFLKIFFLMWTIFKVFIKFVTILFLLYVLILWPRGMWDLSSLTRDRTCTPCIGKRSLNHWTTREVPKSVFKD